MAHDYEDYEGEVDLEEAGYPEDAEEEDSFEREYERIFSGDREVDDDIGQLEYERDGITGRRSKRSRMSILNKAKLSKQELDELFLE